MLEHIKLQTFFLDVETVPVAPSFDLKKLSGTVVRKLNGKERFYSSEEFYTLKLD